MPPLGIGTVLCLSSPKRLVKDHIDKRPFVIGNHAVGIRNIAIHKGLSFGPRSYEHSTCVDIGRVAKRYPDVNFLVYHSGFVANQPEGPYDPARKEGVDALVTSLLDNGIKPGANVYAETARPVGSRCATRRRPRT